MDVDGKIGGESGGIEHAVCSDQSGAVTACEVFGCHGGAEY
jgi:hypothetical protein